jgi:hypothetical protein
MEPPFQLHNIDLVAIQHTKPIYPNLGRNGIVVAARVTIANINAHKQPSIMYQPKVVGTVTISVHDRTGL